MNKQVSIEEKVKELISKNFFIEKEIIQHNTHIMNDLGLDSLGIVELWQLLEDAFGIDIDQDELRKVLNFKDTICYLSILIASKACRLTVEDETKIKNLIIKKLKFYSCAFITEANLFDDFGIDSLDFLSLSMEIEYALNVEIPYENWLEIKTTQDIFNLVSQFKRL